jgi:archaeal flagellar protein FlaG
MSEGILIIASVVIATSIAGVVMSQVGVFESTFTATSESQKDMMLTKVKIVYATNTTDNNVSVWVKNIGINPITSVDKLDVYYGEIAQVLNMFYDEGCLPSSCSDESWDYDIKPDPLWQIMDTFSLNITDNNLKKNVTYVVSVTTPNGVTDEYIFSLPS